ADFRQEWVPRQSQACRWHLPAGRPMIAERVSSAGIASSHRSGVRRGVKRTIDIVGATIGLVLAAPLFVWAAWRIPRETPGPLFYRQRGLGQTMQEFTMLKFRTMAADTDDAPHRAYIEHAMSTEHPPTDGDLYKLDRIDVVTPAGRWLRRTSLDEVPQFINVL